jgi:Cu/Ag efflux pump CusA
VRLDAVADVGFGLGEVAIERRDRERSVTVGANVIQGDIGSANQALMALPEAQNPGAGVHLATTGDTEHDRWREAAEREADRYGVYRQWERERLVGTAAAPVKRSWIDWVLVAISTAVFVFLARHAEAPGLAMDLRWVAILCIVTVALLVAAGMVLWRTTRFN